MLAKMLLPASGGTCVIQLQRDRVVVGWRIQYERLSLGCWSDLKQALCMNVSANGMLLLLNEFLETDEILRLHMRDANRDSPFTLARVRWSQHGTVELNGAMMAGIEYLEPDDPV
jgi:hypothetical protein